MLALHYHCRVACLLHHFAPLIFDLLRTSEYAGDASVSPVGLAPLLPRHAIAFAHRTQQGLTEYSPSQLKSMTDEVLVFGFFWS